MARLKDAHYAETHEWVHLDKKGDATVGITDYAVHQLSDLVHIELPKVGHALEQGKPFGEIESVKTVADLVSPVSGKVTAVNQKLTEDLDLLKEGPFEGGWIIKAKVSDPAELESLMSAEEYEDFLKESGEEEDDNDVDEDDFV